MKALLIYREFPATYWSFKHAIRFLGKRSAFPPLGLLTVAAVLPADKWELRLVAMNVRRLRHRDFKWADMVFIGGMMVRKESARTVIARAWGAVPPLIAGGPLFTCEPESFPEVDHLVLNEAEVTFPRFLADLGSRQIREVLPERRGPGRMQQAPEQQARPAGVCPHDPARRFAGPGRLHCRL